MKAAVLVAALWCALVVTPAGADVPSATAWWSVGNTGVVSSPPPPDVGSDDLLVQGADPSIHQAVAAVRYTLAPGAMPRRLVLELAGSSPSVGVRACRVTGEFSPVRNGRWSDVPRYNCDGAVEGVVDGSRLIFDDVSALAGQGRLSLILLPVGAGRIVVRSPGAASLVVERPASAAPAPAADVPVPAEVSAGEVQPAPVVEQPAPPVGSPAPADAAAPTPAPQPDVAPLRNERGRPEAGDFGPRLLVAAVLFVALAPFALLGRGRRRARLAA